MCNNLAAHRLYRAMKFYTLLFSLFFCCCYNLSAQINYAGKNFFISLSGKGGFYTNAAPPPPQFDKGLYTHVTVQLTSKHYATVQFYYTENGSSNVYNLVPNVPRNIVLTAEQASAIANSGRVEVIRDKSLQISADSNIVVSVGASNFANADGDAMNIIPVSGQKLADTYYLISVKGIGGTDSLSYNYTIVSSADSTMLEITPSSNTAFHRAGMPYRIRLDKGETYSIGTAYKWGSMPITNRDITGSIVKVLNPSVDSAISIYNTYPWVHIGWPIGTKDPSAKDGDGLLEQLLPVSYWDTSYAVVSFKHNVKSLLRIISSADNNIIYYNDQPVCTLSQGEVFDTLVHDVTPALIRSLYPMAIVQFMLSFELGGNGSDHNRDADMLWIYSLKQGLKETYFRRFPIHTTLNYDPKYFLTIISEASNINDITLNGAGISNLFRPFPSNSTMQYAQIWLDTTDIIYHLKSKENIIAYHNQEQYGGSYAYELPDVGAYFEYYPYIYDTLQDTVMLCINDTAVALTADSAMSYQWSTGETTRSINVKDTGTYYVTETLVPRHYVHHVFIVRSRPSPIVDLGNDTIICQGIPLTLKSSVSYSTTARYQWNTNAVDSSISILDGGLYWLAVTDSGCTGIDSIEVELIEDSISILNGDTTLCKGEQMQVNMFSGTSQSYQWIPGIGLSDSTIANPVIIADSTITYTLIASTTYCPDKMDSFRLTVIPAPLVYLGDDTSVCEFNIIQLSGAVIPPYYNSYKYTWTYNGNIKNTQSPTLFYTGDTSGYITLAVTSPNGCIGTDSLFVNVYPGNFALLTSDTSICPNDSALLVGSGGISYKWFTGTQIIDSLTDSLTIYPDRTTAYTMIATNEHNCTDTLMTKTSILPEAVIYLQDSVRIYPGEYYQMQPATNCLYFHWFPSIGLNDVNISNPVAGPEVSTRYFATAYTEHRCVARDSIDVLVDPETLLALPNAFAPGHGPNSIFKIIKRGIAYLDYFRIYNRWGELVFEATDINDGWDGMFNNVPQPEGVYVYVVQAHTSSGYTFSKQGNVTLMR